MLIQFNTDRNIEGHQRLEAYVNEVVAGELANYSDNITRVEVHLSDDNGSKGGQNDKRCVLEARLENRQPIAVTSQANTIEQALNDALEKLVSVLKTIDGKTNSH